MTVCLYGCRARPRPTPGQAHLIKRLPMCPIPQSAHWADPTQVEGRTRRYFDTDRRTTEAISGHYRTRQTHRQSYRDATNYQLSECSSAPEALPLPALCERARLVGPSITCSPHPRGREPYLRRGCRRIRTFSASCRDRRIFGVGGFDAPVIKRIGLAGSP